MNHQTLIQRTQRQRLLGRQLPPPAIPILFIIIITSSSSNRFPLQPSDGLRDSETVEREEGGGGDVGEGCGGGDAAEDGVDVGCEGGGRRVVGRRRVIRERRIEVQPGLYAERDEARLEGAGGLAR